MGHLWVPGEGNGLWSGCWWQRLAWGVLWRAGSYRGGQAGWGLHRGALAMAVGTPTCLGGSHDGCEDTDVSRGHLRWLGALMSAQGIGLGPPGGTAHPGTCPPVPPNVPSMSHVPPSSRGPPLPPAHCTPSGVPSVPRAPLQLEGPPMSPCPSAPGVPAGGGAPMRYQGAGCQCDGGMGLPPWTPSPRATAVLCLSSLYTGGTLLVAFSTPGETLGGIGCPSPGGTGKDRPLPADPRVPSAGGAALPGHVHDLGGWHPPHPHQHAGECPLASTLTPTSGRGTLGRS